MIVTGSVVLIDFPGAKEKKPRPAVVVSTDLYHQIRPDVVVGLLTSNIASATESTDHILHDWAAAGLHVPSAFRSFFATLPQSAILGEIGQLTDADWKEIQARLRIALAVI